MRTELKRSLIFALRLLLVSPAAAGCHGSNSPIGPSADPADPTFAELRIEPAELTLSVGQSALLVLKGDGAVGSIMPFRLMAGASLASSDSAVAEVTRTGLVTARAAGSVVITARVGNVIATARVTAR